MDTQTPDFIDVNGARIAVRHRPGSKAPGIVWLGGYRSDMMGGKAVHLDRWAGETGHACLRHDYSGHGESGGDFNEGTISRWLEESLAVYRRFTEGPQILIGSSMGAWIALRMAQELNKSGSFSSLSDQRRSTPLAPAGIVLIAPAPDFTARLVEPQMTAEQKRDLVEKGYFEKPSEYAPNPYVYTRKLIEDGGKNLVLKGIIETGCPVHILQGMADPDVPYAHAVRLMEHLSGDDVVLTMIRDGDHRLSRPQDIAKILEAAEALAGAP